MKRIVCFILSLLLAAGLCGCGGNLPGGTKKNLQMIVNHVETTGFMIQNTQEVIDWQIEQGTDAIIICGTTGESATMPEDGHGQPVPLFQ